MKTKIASILFAALSFTPLLHAEEKHDHGHSHEQKEAGPNGGRIITSVDPHFEFVITGDRKIKITFLDEHNKPVAPAAQTLTATGGDRSNPTQFTFTQKGETLLSDQPLPEGQKPPIILRIKTTPDAKTVTERFTVNLADCSECNHKEYACTCAHDH
jgi:hypothetical protein